MKCCRKRRIIIGFILTIELYGILISSTTTATNRFANGHVVVEESNKLSSAAASSQSPDLLVMMSAADEMVGDDVDDDESTLDPEEDVYCPQWNTDQTKYGSYAFHKRKASFKEYAARLDCQYLPEVSGAENIFGNPMVYEESGVTAICHLVKNETGFYGVWKDLKIQNCRTHSIWSTTNQVRTLISAPITVPRMRQIKPSLYPLLDAAVNDYESAQILIETISRFLETSEIFEGNKDDPLVIETRDFLFWAIDTYINNVKMKEGQRVLLTKGHIEVESVYFPTNLDLVNSYTFEGLNVSREAISLGTSNHNSRLLIQAYDNDLLYLWGKQKAWDIDNETSVEFLEQEEFNGKWRVIDIKFDGMEIQDLSQPIAYTLPVNTTSNYTWRCAFWDEEQSEWSSEGMTTTILQDEVRCESTHLTAFSALIEPIPYDRSRNEESGLFIIPSIHLHILAVLSSVGSALSIAGLAMTSLTYALFRCLRKERSNKILLNLSTSLLLLHLMSVSSDSNMWDGHCFVPAFLNHYFLLTSLAWMLVEGVHMYQLLISVFVKPETRFILKRAICAWGIPLVLVTISAIVDREVYNAGRDDWCIMGGHLNLSLYYTTYLAPVVLCVGINTFVFVRIIRVLYVQSSRTRKQQQMMNCNNNSNNSTTTSTSTSNEKSNDARARTTDWKSVKSFTSSHHLSPVQIKGALTVMILLGVGWALGLLAVGPFQIVFRYAFCICNAGQGVFIFLFRVVLHPQACRTWRKAVLGSSAESEIFSSSSGTSSSSTGQQRKGHHVRRPSYSVSPTFVSTANSAENTLTKSDTLTTKLASTLLRLIQSNKDAAGEDSTTTNKSEKHVVIASSLD